MSNESAFELSPANRQAGISALVDLPADQWTERWDRIITPPGVKERLLNAMLFCLGPGRKMSDVGLPVHGLILLSGPPGTGKTTLAHGLADRAARELRQRGIASGVRFVLIDPHALPSELLGQSQRGIARLFERAIPDVAHDGAPVVVLIDEVEGLAVSRRWTSTDTNPADVHRSTEAVLTGLDHVARAHPNVVFVATTNFPEAVDEAVLSRVDILEVLGPPSADAIVEILRDSLSELPNTTMDLAGDRLQSLADRLAERSIDARQVRKLVFRAMVSGGTDLALGSRALNMDDLERAISAS
ncbi:MAG: ATPase [Acidimicrobiaceae bacterium]|nr:ATPase [Acidimicrobiaceae bacterium]